MLYKHLMQQKMQQKVHNIYDVFTKQRNFYTKV